jgi:hypothetical protein
MGLGQEVTSVLITGPSRRVVTAEEIARMEMEGLEKRLLMSTAWRLRIQRALVPGLVRFGRLPPVADALEPWPPCGVPSHRFAPFRPQLVG